VFNVELQLQDFEEMVKGFYNFSKELRVSKKSVFSDDIWDFNDDTKGRLRSINDSKLKLNWSKYEEHIPKEVLEAIKVVCCFYLKAPRLVTTNPKVIKNGYKPNSIVQDFTYFLMFISRICLDNTNILMDKSYCIFSNFGDFEWEDIKSEFERMVNYHHPVKGILKAFCNPKIQNYLGCSINWNSADIDNLHVSQVTKLDADSFSDQPIDDKLFIYLTKKATGDVFTFLKLMNIPANCPAPNNFEIESYFEKYEANFQEMFEDYVNLRVSDKENSIKSGKRSGPYWPRKNFETKHGIQAKEFNLVLNRIHKAAITTFHIFTGVRYSEGVSFEKDCLKEIKAGLWVIRGTLSKGENVNQLEGKDEWVACPIVRDAVRVLEEIQRFTFNKYLVSSTFSVYLDLKEEPFSNAGVNLILNNYLKEIDPDEMFAGPQNHLNIHRFRHTLSKQLLRANLGIPYISYHLKHVHNQIIQLEGAISDVTLGYGYISKELVNNATAIRSVKKEIVYDLYHPDSPVAGKNSEDFKERRKAYFQGMMAEGWEEEELMEYLSAKGVPFADVGLGYCGGKKEIVLKNGQKEQPPCVGQLKCNPARCHNALILRNKIPHWKATYKQHKQMMDDPLFAHAYEEHKAFMEEARRVLINLGVKVEEVQ
jgi:integrase